MNKKFVCAALGMVLGAVTALLLVSVLSFEAACALGVLVWAISWWIFKILPDFVTALIMGILFVMLANVPARFRWWERASCRQTQSSSRRAA